MRGQVPEQRIRRFGCAIGICSLCKASRASAGSCRGLCGRCRGGGQRNQTVIGSNRTGSKPNSTAAMPATASVVVPLSQSLSHWASTTARLSSQPHSHNPQRSPVSTRPCLSNFRSFSSGAKGTSGRPALRRRVVDEGTSTLRRHRQANWSPAWTSLTVIGAPQSQWIVKCVKSLILSRFSGDLRSQAELGARSHLELVLLQCLCNNRD